MTNKPNHFKLLSDKIFENQQILQNNPAFRKSIILSDSTAKQFAKKQQIEELREEVKESIRNVVVETMQEIFRDIRLGEISKVEGKEILNMPNINLYRGDNKVLKKQIIDAIKSTTFPGEDVDQETLSTHYNAIITKASQILGNIDSLNNQIDTTANTLIDQAEKMAASQEKQTKQLIFELAAAVTVVAVGFAAMAAFIASTPILIQVGVFLSGQLANAGLAGVSSVIGVLGTMTPEAVAGLGALGSIIHFVCDEVSIKQQQERDIASTIELSKNFLTSIETLKTELKNFKPILPTQEAQTTMKEEAIQAMSHIKKIDEEKSKQNQSTLTPS